MISEGLADEHVRLGRPAFGMMNTALRHLQHGTYRA
jgi:hypothetical protein